MRREEAERLLARGPSILVLLLNNLHNAPT